MSCSHTEHLLCQECPESVADVFSITGQHCDKVWCSRRPVTHITCANLRLLNGSSCSSRQSLVYA